MEGILTTRYLTEFESISYPSSPNNKEAVQKVQDLIQQLLQTYQESPTAPQQRSLIPVRAPHQRKGTPSTYIDLRTIVKFVSEKMKPKHSSPNLLQLSTTSFRLRLKLPGSSNFSFLNQRILSTSRANMGSPYSSLALHYTPPLEQLTSSTNPTQPVVIIEPAQPPSPSGELENTVFLNTEATRVLVQILPMLIPSPTNVESNDQGFPLSTLHIEEVTDSNPSSPSAQSSQASPSSSSFSPPSSPVQNPILSEEPPEDPLSLIQELLFPHGDSDVNSLSDPSPQPPLSPAEPVSSPQPSPLLPLNETVITTTSSKSWTLFTPFAWVGQRFIAFFSAAFHYLRSWF